MQHNFTAGLASLARLVSANKTKLLTFGAMGGVALTATIALREGPEIRDIIEEKMKDLEETPKEDKETRRVVYGELARKAGPKVLKVIAAAAFTMTCIFQLNVVHTNNYMAAAALTAVTQKKLTQLEDATRDAIGEKKLEKIKEEIASQQAKEKPANPEPDPFNGRGQEVYDPQTGFTFWVKDPSVLRDARACLQEQINNNIPWVSVNDFYEKCIDRYVNFRFSAFWGWNMGEKIDIEWKSGTDLDGNVCWILEYDDATLRKDAWGDIRPMYQ